MTNLKVALRQLSRSPGFATVAVLTLALGIGLSAGSFSLANAFLLRNVPYADAGRLVRIFATSPQSQTRGHAPGNIIDVREAATSFERFSLYNFDALALGEPGQPAELVNSLSVTADFFDLLGVHPVLGRGFTPDEDEVDKPRVAILTHRAWTRRYGSDPNVIGHVVRLNTEPYTIIGVMSDAFDAPLVWGPVDVIMPRTLHPSFRDNRTDSWMQGVARLKPGVNLAAAQSELATIAARLVQDYPNENGDKGLRVVNLHDSNMDGVSRALLWLMTGISLAMLLIACANLASLQVARAFGRSREFAVRAALGGGRRHLMYPLLIESLLLAIVGGGFSLLIAWGSNRLIGSFLLINGEHGYDIALDHRVLAFATFCALLSGVAFGIAPAWIASRSSAAEALKAGTRSATATRSHQILKRVLIVSEMAVALALVGVASAFGIGSQSFLRRDVGWKMDGVFTGNLALPYDRYSDNERNREFQRDTLDRLASIPGVDHAALTTGLPLFQIGGASPLAIEGQPLAERGHEPTAEVASVSPGYFATLEIPLRQGTLFTSAIEADDPPVAVINETMANHLWPQGNAIGRRVRVGDDETWIEIIGIVGDVGFPARLQAPETRMHLFRPLIQVPRRYLSVILRTKLAPEALTKSAREAIAAVDPDLPIANAGSLRALFNQNMSNLNLVIINLSLSAGMGLLIASVGLFGVISQLTAQRTRDIGVRMALGAQSTNIMRMVIGEGMLLFGFGALLGVIGYFLLSLVFRRAMPEMQLPGWWLVAANVSVFAITTLLASYLPATRATRINPVEALRAE